MHDVLDPHDGDAGAFDITHQLHELGAFCFGQAAGDLVEQQEPRRAGERARELEPLAAEQIERAPGTALDQRIDRVSDEIDPLGQRWK